MFLDRKASAWRAGTQNPDPALKPNGVTVLCTISKQHHSSGIDKKEVVCQSAMAKWAKP